MEYIIEIISKIVPLEILMLCELLQLSLSEQHKYVNKSKILKL